MNDRYVYTDLRSKKGARMPRGRRRGTRLSPGTKLLIKQRTREALAKNRTVACPHCGGLLDRYTVRAATPIPISPEMAEEATGATIGVSVGDTLQHEPPPPPWQRKARFTIKKNVTPAPVTPIPAEDLWYAIYRGKSGKTSVVLVREFEPTQDIEAAREACRAFGPPHYVVSWPKKADRDMPTLFEYAIFIQRRVPSGDHEDVME